MTTNNIHMTSERKVLIDGEKQILIAEKLNCFDILSLYGFIHLNPRILINFRSAWKDHQI